MLKEAIEKLVALAAPTTFDITDTFGVKATYSSAHLREITAAPEPIEPKVVASTITGFGDLIREKLGGHAFDEPGAWLIQVEDERTLSLYRSKADKWGRREALVFAQPLDFKQFRFDSWMPQEEFAIAIASLFADSADRAYVLQMASTLTNDPSTTSEDDGFTQRVTVKAGLQLKSLANIKPRVALAPFRTFPELRQPVSEFVFRARIPENGQPQLMLTEADGGRWKVEAMQIIREAVLQLGLGIPVIA